MGIVRFESQEYRFGGRMQVFAKLIQIIKILGKVGHDEHFCQLTYGSESTKGGQNPDQM